MNKLEIYSDLSFNFDTDFESMLMESMIDEAECESRAAHMALESYLASKVTDSVDNALESLMAVLEGKDEDCCDEDEKCEDGECKKKDSEDDDKSEEDKDDEDDEEDEEDAEEAALRAACEAADASVGQKIVAAWKAFKGKVIAFLSRVAQSLKNVATNFSAKLAKAKVKEDIKVPGVNAKFMQNIQEYTAILNGVGPMDVDEAVQKMTEYKKKTEEAAMQIKDDEIVTVPAAEVKKWMADVSGLLKACQKALSAMDKRISDLTKQGSEDARSNFAESRSVITEAMQLARKSVSVISVAVGKANAEAKADAKIEKINK